MLEDKPYFCMFHMAIDIGKERIVEDLLKKIRAGEFERRYQLTRTQLLAVVANEAKFTALFQQDGFDTLLDRETLQTAFRNSVWYDRIKVARTLTDVRADVNLGQLRECSDWLDLGGRQHNRHWSILRRLQKSAPVLRPGPC